MDFVQDALNDSQRFRILNVVDDFTGECLASVVETSMSDARVIRELHRLCDLHGSPLMIVSENGTDLMSRAVLSWVEETGVEWHYMAPGWPVQNAFVGSFNLKLRDECLNEHVFTSLAEQTPPGGCSFSEESSVRH